MNQEGLQFHKEPLEDDQKSRERSGKEKRWEQERRNVEEITDKLEEGIDEGIKDTVIALRVLEFPTSGSCEGHTSGEHGTPYPWIDICVPRPEGYEEDEEDREKRHEWNIENLKEQKRMIDLLDEFYSDRKTPFDVMISFRHIGIYGEFRLQSFGADIMELMTPEEQEEKRRQYKKELDDFAQFCKEEYLAE